MLSKYFCSLPVCTYDRLTDYFPDLFCFVLNVFKFHDSSQRHAFWCRVRWPGHVYVAGTLRTPSLCSPTVWHESSCLHARQCKAKPVPGLCVCESFNSHHVFVYSNSAASIPSPWNIQLRSSVGIPTYKSVVIQTGVTLGPALS